MSSLRNEFQQTAKPRPFKLGELDSFISRVAINMQRAFSLSLPPHQPQTGFLDQPYLLTYLSENLNTLPFKEAACGARRNMLRQQALNSIYGVHVWNLDLNLNQ